MCTWIFLVRQESRMCHIRRSWIFRPSFKLMKMYIQLYCTNLVNYATCLKQTHRPPTSPKRHPYPPQHTLPYTRDLHTNFINIFFFFLTSSGPDKIHFLHMKWSLKYFYVQEIDQIANTWCIIFEEKYTFIPWSMNWP